MAFTSSYTPGLIQQSEYYYGTPEMTPGLSGSFSGSFQGDGSALTGVSAFPFTGDAQITGSLIISSSFADFSGITNVKTRKFAVSSGDFKPGNKVTSASFYDGFIEALDAAGDGDFIHCFANDSSSAVADSFTEKNVTIVGNGHTFTQNGYSNQFQRYTFTSCSLDVHNFTFNRDNSNGSSAYPHASAFRIVNTTLNLFGGGCFSGSNSAYSLIVNEDCQINGGHFYGELNTYGTSNRIRLNGLTIENGGDGIDFTGDNIEVLNCDILYAQGASISAQSKAISIIGNSSIIQNCHVEGDKEANYGTAIRIGSNTGGLISARNEIQNVSINQGEIYAYGYTDIKGCSVFGEGNHGINHSGTGSIANCSIDVPGNANYGYGMQLTSDSLIRVSNVYSKGNLAGVRFSGRKQFFNCVFEGRSTNQGSFVGADVTDLEVSNLTAINYNGPNAINVTMSGSGKALMNDVTSTIYNEGTTGYDGGFYFAGSPDGTTTLTNIACYFHSTGGDSGTSTAARVYAITGSTIDNFYSEGYKVGLDLRAISSSISNVHTLLKSDVVYSGNEASLKLYGDQNRIVNSIFEIDKAHQDSDPVVKIFEGTHYFRNNTFRASKSTGQYLITGSANVSASLVDNIYEVADEDYIIASNVNNITTGFIDGKGNWHRSQVTSSFGHIEATSFKGDGSQLTNLPISDPFPHTASSAAIISRSIASGDTDSTALRLFGSGSISESGIFEVEGSAGPLFSVQDGLDGVLMEVNNITGLPLFQVSSSNEVFINRGNLTSGVNTATASFSHFTGSFQGDGSQLTNLNTTTPTLQQVTDQGSSTTTPITASIISASGKFIGTTGSFGRAELGKSGALNGSIKFNTLHGPAYELKAHNNSLTLSGTTGATVQGFALDSQIENFTFLDGGSIQVQKGITTGSKKGGGLHIEAQGFNQSNGKKGIFSTDTTGPYIGNSSYGSIGTHGTFRIINGLSSDNDADSGSFTSAEFGDYIKFNLPITASGNISASGNITSAGLTLPTFTTNRVPFIGSNGILSTDSGFEYNSTTNQLSVDSLNVIHLTSSFITSSRIHTSGSNIFGDDTTDTQTLIGTTKMTGSAQITGSTSILGALDVIGNTEITGSLIVSGSGITSIGDITASNEMLVGSTLNVGKSPYHGQYKGNINVYNSNGTGKAVVIKQNAASVQNVGNITIGSGTDATFLTYSNFYKSFIGGSLSINTGNTVTNSFTSKGASALYVGGNTEISGSVSISGSGGLSVESSGSTVFEVIGSEGTLFSIDDDLDGTIFTANDRSGLPVLETSASGEVYIGKSPQSLYTTAVISSTTANISQSIYGLSTSSYDGVFVDYTATSASNARAGSIMSIWNGSNLNFTETTTTDIGDTTNLIIQVAISQSQAQIQSYATTAGYKIKTIIRSI